MKEEPPKAIVFSPPKSFFRIDKDLSLTPLIERVQVSEETDKAVKIVDGKQGITRARKHTLTTDIVSDADLAFIHREDLVVSIMNKIEVLQKCLKQIRNFEIN